MQRLQMISNVYCCQIHNEIAHCCGVAVCSANIACGTTARIMFDVTANRFGKRIHAMQITNMIIVVMTTISPTYEIAYGGFASRRIDH